jgi:hypothetical protein
MMRDIIQIAVPEFPFRDWNFSPNRIVPLVEGKLAPLDAAARIHE